MFQGSNYTDDIPIIFSNKWNLPALPVISKKCINPVLQISELLTQHQFDYDYSLERKILEKIEEWKIIKFRKIDERERRITLREEVKRQQLKTEESILKEELTKISYPSPDGIESCEDELFEKKVKNQVFNNIGSILKPTKLENQKINSNEALYIPKGTTIKRSQIKLADFENDTSDPFNTMELKTMDDLNILEQILKVSINENLRSHNSCSENSYNETDLPRKEAKLEKPDSSTWMKAVDYELINTKMDETKDLKSETSIPKCVPENELKV
ncbi:ubiquitin-associated protein 1-like [Culicoides brevitarsis]|uniref:ubiquitin-associated protein 1-like n=1 Tax=Culicoides brevitarsis TaxID=469753 RepID=UPI00307C5E98